MRAKKLHRWDLGYKEAVAVQGQLAKQTRLTPLLRPVQAVAGADVSYARQGHRLYGAVLVFTLPDLGLAEQAFASGTTRFPYIPGLLSFREGPVLIRAFRKIRTKPDVIMFDGQGIAHPRRLGLACHMGLLLDSPTIGCAKTRLLGNHGPLPATRGSSVQLTEGGRVVGRVVRTREGVKPVFVSPGHAVTLDDATSLVLECCRKYRLPEPIRQAHLAVNRMRLSNERTP